MFSASSPHTMIRRTERLTAEAGPIRGIFPRPPSIRTILPLPSPRASRAFAVAVDRRSLRIVIERSVDLGNEFYAMRDALEASDGSRIVWRRSARGPAARVARTHSRHCAIPFRNISPRHQLFSCRSIGTKSCGPQKQTVVEFLSNAEKYSFPEGR